MNFIRGLLPGSKHRLVTGDKSLDLSYITPRMIAMSYPSDNIIESLYHNDINEVSEYLNENHKNNYFIYNLSGLKYNESKFNNNVELYEWKDHHPPPLKDIFKLFFEASEFLKRDPKNVIALHCLAGKGRTGTVCCAFLLLSMLINNKKDAIDYYSLKRFHKLNKGVQQPSQLRYLSYIEQIMSNISFKNINSVVNINQPYSTGKEPIKKNYRELIAKYFLITNVSADYINVKEGDKIDYKIETNYYKDENCTMYYINNGYLVIGDFIINIYKNGKLLAYIGMNTSFMNENENQISFGIENIDPRELKEKPEYTSMRIQVNYAPIKLDILNSKDINARKIKDLYDKEIKCVNYINKCLEYISNCNLGQYYEMNSKNFYANNVLDIDTVLNNKGK